jgi:SAM-dependent methyltransferase
MSRDGRDDATVARPIPSSQEDITPRTAKAADTRFPPADGLTRIAAWDKWCETDYVRNAIVIPHLKQLIAHAPPDVISDVGCGSGYIARTLIQAQSGGRAQWLLVDSNKTALMYAHDATAILARVDAFHIDVTRQLKNSHIPSADLAFMAFTLLEFRLTPMVATNLGSLVRTGGTLSIFIPDTLWDVYTCGLGLETMREYMRGYAVLQKRDSLTGSLYRFHANRIELLLALLTAAGFNLVSLTTHQRPGRESGDSILILDFKKGGISDKSG